MMLHMRSQRFSDSLYVVLKVCLIIVLKSLHSIYIIVIYMEAAWRATADDNGGVAGRAGGRLHNVRIVCTHQYKSIGIYIYGIYAGAYCCRRRRRVWEWRAGRAARREWLR